MRWIETMPNDDGVTEHEPAFMISAEGLTDHERWVALPYAIRHQIACWSLARLERFGSDLARMVQVAQTEIDNGLGR